jgi:hypothetical protein
MVTQLAREAGAYVIGLGRTADSQTSLDFGANEFVDLENDVLEDVRPVDLVFDVIGGDIGKRSAHLIRAGGTLVSIVGPVEARPADGLAVDFVVGSDRAQLTRIVQRVRDGCLRTNIQASYSAGALARFGYNGALKISFVHAGPINLRSRVPSPIRNGPIRSNGTQMIGTIGADGSPYDGGGNGGRSG